MSILSDKALWGAIPRPFLSVSEKGLSDATRQALIQALEEFMPSEAILTSQEALLAYSYDATGERHFPDVVLLPSCVIEIVLAMKVAGRLGVHVISRGAASNLSGGTMPVVGGLVISTAKLKQIKEVNWQEGWVEIEPGVVNADLQAFLRPFGFFYPPDPSSHRISTLGGNIAENSGGPHCVKYGVTTNNVIQLEMVTWDGTRLMLPVANDVRVGLDLTGLVVGSEGTLGVVVGARLAILPLPEMTQTMLAVFGSVEDALQCVSSIIAARILPATLELLDKVSIEVVERFVHAGYPTGAEAVLLIEVDGDDRAVAFQTNTIAEVASSVGAISFRVAADAHEADLLWKGRRSQYGAAAQVAPHLWVQDVTVPRPHLAAMMSEVLRIGTKYGFFILTVAHAGDGNLHPIIPYNPADPDEVQRMRLADHEILLACVQFGGSITGEHGVGIDKLENLALMYNDAELGLMMAVKSIFDPQHLLNPYKAVLPPQQALPTRCEAIALAPEKPIFSPSRLEQVPAFLAWAQEEGMKIRITGSGQHFPLAGLAEQQGILLSTHHLSSVVDFDPGNLTIEVEAGVTLGALRDVIAAKGLGLPALQGPNTSTLGGLVARNARSWRQSFGFGLRDSLIATEWMDGRGQRLRFGRKAVKNVAGYDMSKLALGSWGHLGLLTKLTLRLQPLFDPQIVLRFWGPSLLSLLDVADLYLQRPSRPQGMLITQGLDRKLYLDLLTSGPDAAGLVNYSGQLSEVQGLNLTIMEGAEGVAQVDQLLESLRAFGQQTGEYRQGALARKQLKDLEAQLSQVDAFALFPASGAYEVFGVTAQRLLGEGRSLQRGRLLLIQDRPTAYLVQGIKKTFDPLHLFQGGL